MNLSLKVMGLDPLLLPHLSSSLNNWLQKLLKTDQVNLYTNINTSDFNFEKGITQKQIGCAILNGSKRSAGNSTNRVSRS